MTQPTPQMNADKLLFELMFLVQERMNAERLASDPALSPVQVMILRALAQQGPMPQKRLGQLLGRDKSQIARLVQDLEQRQIVTRTPGEDDRRSRVVAASPGALARIGTILAAERDVVARMLAGLGPDEVAGLERTLTRMIGNLKPGDGAPRRDPVPSGAQAGKVSAGFVGHKG